MKPNKSIPSFCFKSPWLKYIDVEAELTRLVTEEMNRGIADATLQDLMTVQPIYDTQGNLFYFDYNYGPMDEPVVYEDGSWSMSNTFEGVIGIKSEIKHHTLI